MRIAIHSASGSVCKTLEAIIIAAGHHAATSGSDAELVLRDTIHPASIPLPGCPVLALVPAGVPVSDDQLTCPLRPSTLIQRLLLRAQTQAITLASGWSLDMLARQLTHADNAPASLTEKECSLLKTLASARDVTLTREQLLTQVWGIGGAVDTHTLETHIYRLRAKLAELSPSPGDIVTENGAYLLVFTANPR